MEEEKKRKSEERRDRERDEGGERAGEYQGGGKGAGWPFFAEHRHSLCILSSFKSTYTICSCRLVDILVYVHSSERTHAKSIIGDGGGVNVESCKGAFAVFNLWGSCDENCFKAVSVFKGAGRLEVCLARGEVTGGRNKWKMEGDRAKTLHRSIVCLFLHPTSRVPAKEKFSDLIINEDEETVWECTKPPGRL